MRRMPESSLVSLFHRRILRRNLLNGEEDNGLGVLITIVPLLFLKYKDEPKAFVTIFIYDRNYNLLDFACSQLMPSRVMSVSYMHLAVIKIIFNRF
jgi:hypothetical protein